MSAAANSKRKYLLFSKDDGRADAVKPCAFFSTPAGCRSGDKCAFSHGQPKSQDVQSTPFRPPAEDANKKSKHRVASEASIQPVVVASVPPTTPANLFKNNNSNVRDEDDDDVDDDEEEFLFDAVNTALKGGQTLSPQLLANGGDLFVKNNTVMNVLKTSGTPHATHGNTVATVSVKKNKNMTMDSTFLAVEKGIVATAPVAKYAKPVSNQKTHLEVSNITSAQLATKTPSVPHQAAAGNGAGRLAAWVKLVTTTQSHKRFAHDYDLGKGEDSSWVSARAPGDWSKHLILPQVIAIDCEMCETTDPVTQALDTSALIRFSAINALTPDEVLVDQLVAPGLPVSDMRTKIHGISEGQVRGVCYTLRHAQAALLKLCTESTILVGHSLHNDLKSLRFKHMNVVDTSYLYTLKNEPSAAPSLRNIAEEVLKLPLPELHDSVQDARVAVQAAEHHLTHGPCAPITRTSGASTVVDTDTADAANCWLVHRVPQGCQEQHIFQMIATNTHVLPVSVGPVTMGAAGMGAGESPDMAPRGKSVITFSSAAHATLAFDSLAGPNRPDKQHRAQKRVYLSVGGYLCVRKN